MAGANSWVVNSPLGRHEIDHLGSPIGVVRMDSAKSYSGIGALLQAYIHDSDQESWKKIKESRVREIRMHGLRHRRRAKAAGNSYSLYPHVTAPILDSTAKIP